MGTLIDLTGERFGKLLVIERVENATDGKAKWRCLCDCGTLIAVASTRLRNVKATSCGCDKRPNLIGQKYGRWTVIDKAEKRGRYYYWKCSCICGNEKEVRERNLLDGTSISCGCYQKEIAAKIGANRKDDLTGMRFGKLVVLERVKYAKELHTSIWKCQCQCGNVKNVSTTSLYSGKSNSCGCLYKEAATKRENYHGDSGTRLFSIWCGMLNRCKNKNIPSYKRYGGRGIIVCDEWQEYIPFRDWALSNGYKEGLSIDRINNDGNYEPSNCRWATAKQQSNNRSSNILLTYNGETKTATQWGEEIGISGKVICKRKHNGWTDEECLEVPYKKHSNQQTIEQYRKGKKL